jgi:hypothetical protein
MSEFGPANAPISSSRFSGLEFGFRGLAPAEYSWKIFSNSSVIEDSLWIQKRYSGVYKTQYEMAIRNANNTFTGDIFLNKVTSPILTVGANTSTDTRICVNGAAAQARELQFQTAGVARWRFVCNTTAEVGANAGSNLDVIANDDTGAIINTPISIARAATGIIALNRHTRLTGLLYSNSSNGGIFGNTNAAADNYTTTLSSTTGQSSTRGGYIVVKGNEVAATGGDILIEAGNSITGSGEIKLYAGNTERMRITKAGTINFYPATVQAINAMVASNTDISWNTVVTGDSFGRTTIYPSKIEFGAGGATARDTNLYRNGVNELKTDDSFIVAGWTEFQSREYVAIRSVATAGGTTTALSTDSYVVFSGTTTQTYTLPATDAKARKLIVKNRSTGIVTVNSTGADTIDGGTTVSLATNQSLTFVNNGTDWCIL